MPARPDIESTTRAGWGRKNEISLWPTAGSTDCMVEIRRVSDRFGLLSRWRRDTIDVSDKDMHAGAWLDRSESISTTPVGFTVRRPGIVLALPFALRARGRPQRTAAYGAFEVGKRMDFDRPRSDSE
jgi:hypothetical protein